MKLYEVVYTVTNYVIAENETEALEFGEEMLRDGAIDMADFSKINLVEEDYQD